MRRRGLGAQQGADDMGHRLLSSDPLLEDLVIGCPHAGQLQLTHQVEDLNAFQ